MRSLAIASLSIRDFRNLAKVDLDLGPRFNVVSGDNGQGKTNLLEAVYVLATSRSFRRRRLEELVATRRGDGQRPRRASSRRARSASRASGCAAGSARRAIDGKRPPSLAAYALRTPIVVFHPARWRCRWAEASSGDGCSTGSRSTRRRRRWPTASSYAQGDARAAARARDARRAARATSTAGRSSWCATGSRSATPRAEAADAA